MPESSIRIASTSYRGSPWFVVGPDACCPMTDAPVRRRVSPETALLVLVAHAPLSVHASCCFRCFWTAVRGWNGDLRSRRPSAPVLSLHFWKCAHHIENAYIPGIGSGEAKLREGGCRLQSRLSADGQLAGIARAANAGNRAKQSFQSRRPLCGESSRSLSRVIPGGEYANVTIAFDGPPSRGYACMHAIPSCWPP